MLATVDSLSSSAISDRKAGGPQAIASGAASAAMALSIGCQYKQTINVVMPEVTATAETVAKSEKFSWPDIIEESIVSKPRRECIKTIEELFEKQAKIKTTKKCCLLGMGGIGKAELVKQYFFSHEYKILLWFNASDDKKLQEQLFRFASEKLGKPRSASETTGEERQTLLEEIVLELAKLEKSLLVYEDADCFESIEKYIPKMALAVDVLITSRHVDKSVWNSLPTIEIATMNAEDSLSLFNNPCIDSSRVFCAKLGYLPRALRQCSLYIAKNLVASTSDHLENYNVYPLPYIKDDTSECTYKSLKLSITYIRTSHANLLNILFSFLILNAKSISKLIFTESDDNNEKRNAINFLSILINYSLLFIDTDKVNIRLHPVMHEVLKDVMISVEEESALKYLKTRRDTAKPTSTWLPMLNRVLLEYRSKFLPTHSSAVPGL